MGGSLVRSTDKSQALSQVARDFYNRGWMRGTAGNLSARETETSMWITASGKSKGLLEPKDLLLLDINSSEVLVQNQQSNSPSAETEIHQSIYRLFPEARACFHVHSIDACLATSQHARETHLLLPPLEMLKGFDIWEQSPTIALPVFPNHLDVSKIAEDIQKQFSQRKPDISALMIQDHGITVWGNSIEQTYNRVEVLEFVMSYMARMPPER